MPARAIEAGGRAFAVGVQKHGLADNGRGTYRVAGTDQSKPDTHWASLFRHLYAYRRGELADPDSGLSHLDHAMAQLAIIVDLVEDPPGETEERGHFPPEWESLRAWVTVEEQRAATRLRTDALTAVLTRMAGLENKRDEAHRRLAARVEKATRDAA